MSEKYLVETVKNSNVEAASDYFAFKLKLKAEEIKIEEYKPQIKVYSLKNL